MSSRDSVFPYGTIFEKLFYFLWKNPEEMERNLIVNLPDTIFFKNTMIHSWYFSDRNGVIRRKKPENCSLKNIYNALIKDVAPGQVCCCFFFTDNYNNTIDYSKPVKKHLPNFYSDHSNKNKV